MENNQRYGAAMDGLSNIYTREGCGVVITSLERIKVLPLLTCMSLSTRYGVVFCMWIISQSTPDYYCATAPTAREYACLSRAEGNSIRR
jgi:hypothetical protein